MEEKNNQFSKESQEAATKDFITLLSLNQTRINTYILSMVGNYNDTDDIIQETTLTMWQKFREFKSGTDFLSWGISIAYYKIKEFRKKKRIPQFSEELLEQLHSKAPDKLKDINVYIENLENCLKKLDPGDYSLVNQRYILGSTAVELAKKFNVTVQSVYFRLAKIQGILTRCIKRSVLMEETI